MAKQETKDDSKPKGESDNPMEKMFEDFHKELTRAAKDMEKIIKIMKDMSSAVEERNRLREENETLRKKVGRLEDQLSLLP